MSEYNLDRIVALGFNEINGYQNTTLQWITEPVQSKPGILALSTSVQMALISLMVLSLLIGSTFKCILYAYCYVNYKLHQHTLIDVLILTAAIVQHVINAIYAFHFVLVFLSGSTLQNILGHWYCTICAHALPFELIYMTVGSFGISLFRILYIKKGDWVKNVIGEKLLLNVIWFGGILLSGFLAMNIQNNTYYLELRAQHCGQLGDMFVKTMIEYNTIKGKNIKLHSLNNLMVSMGLMGMTVGELLMYIMLFYHLYRQDNQATLRTLLGPAAIQARNRKNAVTFFGQFCAFVFEMVLLVIITVLHIAGKNNHFYYTIIPVFRPFGFALLSIVEVLTSNQLRPRMFNPLQNTH